MQCSLERCLQRNPILVAQGSFLLLLETICEVALVVSIGVSYPAFLVSVLRCPGSKLCRYYKCGLQFRCSFLEICEVNLMAIWLLTKSPAGMRLLCCRHRVLVCTYTETNPRCAGLFAEP